jgi:hypothetical protein
MMAAMLHRIVAWTVGVGTFFLMPALALASKPTEQDKEILDARLESYGRNVTLESGSVAMIWFLFVIMGIVCLVVMFKDARRSHLD